MTTDAEIDILFTSGYTLATATTSAPCDFWDVDAVQSVDSDLGGVMINTLTVLVRRTAFPELAGGDLLTLRKPDETEDDAGTQYSVQGAPLRIQDGAVLEVRLQVAEDPS